MTLRLNKILPLIAITVSLGSLTACAQPNWYKAGKWNYAHQNYDKALPQLLWSAQLGDADAQYAVGYMYYNGLGTPTDDVLAYHWFSKAAKAGNNNAVIALQQMEGITTPKMKHRHHSAPLKPQHRLSHQLAAIPTPNTTHPAAKAMPAPTSTHPQAKVILPTPKADV